MQHDRFEISHQIHNSSYSMHTAHSHSYCEMYYLMSGACDILIKDSTYSISSGTVVFIPADTLHKTTYTGSASHERIYIEFSDSYISDMYSEYGKTWLQLNLFNTFMLVPPQHRADFNAILSDIIKEQNNDNTFSGRMKKLYFQQLIITLLRYNCIENFPGTPNSKIADLSINDAMKYINSNYQYPITLASLAKLLNLNSSYLSLKFKSVNGIGFKEYLNNVRIGHAEKLLLETNKSITSIALESGFESSNYFGDIFKKRNGISPSEFRKLKGNIK